MQWTNVFRLPLPLAEAIMEDLYYGKREEGILKYCAEKGLDRTKIVHFSVNELIKSPRQVLLPRRHDDKIIKDVASEVFRLLGTAIHYLLWAAAKRMNERGLTAYYTAEERLFYHFNVDGQVVVVSGEPDLVNPAGVIDDYKVTAVWSWIKGIKDEWEKQLNLYAMFRTLAGKLTTGLSICFILRDWNVNETMQEGYAPAQAQQTPVEMWDFERQKAYLMERIHLHLSVRDTADDELPECTGAEVGPNNEMWEKEEAYAVIREGGVRAAKVLILSKTQIERLPGETKEQHLLREANLDMDRRNDNPKIIKGKEKGYILEHRPGERTKCLRFCAANIVCNQFKEYSAAAFRGPARDKVEEVS